jgi:hypothetical protein
MKNLQTFEKFLTERKELNLNTWEESPGIINRFRLGSEVIGLRSVLNLSREKWTRSCSAFSPNEIGFENATDRKEAAEWIEKSFKSGKLKLKDYELNERLNEDYVEYSINDFPIGAEVHMSDEIWLVVKPGNRNEKIFMAPFNREAKSRYIQIAIEFDLNWLNANITKIDKK